MLLGEINEMVQNMRVPYPEGRPLCSLRYTEERRKVTNGSHIVHGPLHFSFRPQ